MNHKDLLDDVVKGMTASTAESSEEKTSLTPDDAFLKVGLSMGNEFSIDINTLDWNTISANSYLMDINLHNINAMIRAMLCKEDDDEVVYIKSEADKRGMTVVDMIIHDMGYYLEAQGVENDYEDKIKEGVGKQTIAMVMCCDAITITRVMHEQAMLFKTLELFRNADKDIDKMLETLGDSLPSEYMDTDTASVDTESDNGITYVESEEEADKELMYVTGRFGPDDDEHDRLIEITDIAPHYGEAIDPSKQYIVDILDEETVGVFVMAKNLTDARKIATDIFDTFFDEGATEKDELMNLDELMSAFTFEGVDDHDVSGLLEH